MERPAIEGQRQLARGARISFLVVTFSGLAVVLRILAPFFAVLFLALVVAALVYPQFQRLVAILKGRRQLAALAVCLLFVLAVAAPLVLTVRSVSEDALAFYEITTGQLTESNLLRIIEERKGALDKVNGLLAPIGLTVTVQELYRATVSTGVKLGAFFYQHGVLLAKGLARLVIGFSLWILILFYFLVDGEALRRWFEQAVPLPLEQQRLVRRRFVDMSASLVVGNGLAGLIQGVAGGVVFAILGLPGPALWGVVMVILAFIPVIGISLVYIPAAIILILAGEPGRAFMMLIPLMAVATVVEFWIKPLLVGRRGRMHTLLVFLSLFGGLDAFGVVGLVVGPLLMAAFLTLVAIYREHYRPLIVSDGEAVEATQAGKRTDREA